jgi:hypothetical protein
MSQTEKEFRNAMSEICLRETGGEVPFDDPDATKEIAIFRELFERGYKAGQAFQMQATLFDLPGYEKET